MAGQWLQSGFGSGQWLQSGFRGLAATTSYAMPLAPISHTQGIPTCPIGYAMFDKEEGCVPVGHAAPTVSGKGRRSRGAFLSPGVHGLGGATVSMGTELLQGSLSRTAVRQSQPAPVSTLLDSPLPAITRQNVIASAETSKALTFAQFGPACNEFLTKNPRIRQAAIQGGIDDASLLQACAGNHDGFVKAMQEQGLTDDQWYKNKLVWGGAALAAIVGIVIVKKVL